MTETFTLAYPVYTYVHRHIASHYNKLLLLLLLGKGIQLISLYNNNKSLYYHEKN